MYAKLAGTAVLLQITSRFGDLKNWFKTELRGSIKEIVKEELTTQLGQIKKEVNDVKKESEKMKQSVASNSTKIANLEEEVKVLKEVKKEEASISKNNLKYLINIDRNERRQNVILFGVPEEDLNINEPTSTTDEEKCMALFTQMGVHELRRNAIKEIFLGK